MVLRGLADNHLLTKSLKRVSALQLLQLLGRVLIKELVNRHEASTNSNCKVNNSALTLNLVLLDLDEDFFAPKLIHAFALSHEHDLEPLPVRVVVDEVRQFLINRVVFDRNVHRDLAL